MSFLDAREHGSKPGSGFISSGQEYVDRRERLRRLALETIDLDKDPYFMKNHLGKYECRLCLTLHPTEGSYLAHTQGKRHQQNLAKRAKKEAMEKNITPKQQVHRNVNKKVRIGRPGYRVTKQFDTHTSQRSLLFQIDYPEIEESTKPHHRFMSAFEQRKEPTDRRYQYVLFHADPYEIIAFKIPSYEVDGTTNHTDVTEFPNYQEGHVESSSHKEKYFAHWNPDNKIYTLQIYFKHPNGNTPREFCTPPAIFSQVPFRK